MLRYDHSYRLGLVGSVGEDTRESCKTKADRVKKSTSKCCGTARYVSLKSRNHSGKVLTNLKLLSVPEGLFFAK